MISSYFYITYNIYGFIFTFIQVDLLFLLTVSILHQNLPLTLADKDLDHSQILIVTDVIYK